MKWFVWFTAIVLFTQSALVAQITSYSQDFEGMDVNSPTALSDDGWLYFAASSLGYTYAGPAPNTFAQISNVLAETAPGLGDQHLNIYSDYQNVDAHSSGNPVTISVYQEQTFTPGELGSTVGFEFDYAGAIEQGFDFSPTGQTTTIAFIRVFDPVYNPLQEVVLDTVSATDFPGFDSALLSIVLDPIWINGGVIQFGFGNTAANVDNSGIYYDNINFGVIPTPAALPAGLLGLGLFATRRRR